MAKNSQYKKDLSVPKAKWLDFSIGIFTNIGILGIFVGYNHFCISGWWFQT
jgi:hypothetical protein